MYITPKQKKRMVIHTKLIKAVCFQKETRWTIFVYPRCWWSPMGLPDFGIIIFEKTGIKKKKRTRQNSKTLPTLPNQGLRVSCVSRLSRVRGDLRDFLLFPNDLQPQKNNQPTNQAAGGIRYVPIFFFPLQLTQPLSSSWWLNQPCWKISIRPKWEFIFPNFRAEHSKNIRVATTQSFLYV